MSDGEARFARKLGLAVGMWDWWRIKGLHTPQEWALQLAAESIDPYGEERDDMRAAINTANIIASNSVDVSSEQMGEMIDGLRSYLSVNQIKPEVVGAAAIRRLMGE